MKFARVILTALVVAMAAEASPMWGRQSVDVCSQQLLDKLHSICLNSNRDVIVGTWINPDVVNTYRPQLQWAADYCCQMNCPIDDYVSYCF